MKELPCDTWAKEHDSYPFLGLMASEGGQREFALMKNGCNYYGKNTIRSAPFAPFMRQDVLQLALDLKVPVPEAYGTVIFADSGFIWKNGLIDLTGCGKKMRKHGTSGCTKCARIRRQENTTVGAEFWITSESSGKIGM